MKFAVLAGLLFGNSAFATLVTNLPTDSVFVCNAGVAHQENGPNSGANSLVVQYEDPSMPANSEARFRTEILTAQDSSSSRQLFPTEADLWTHQIFANQFDFTTEKFGAKYFIDLCYRGPEKVLAPGSTHDLTEGVYILDLSVNLADATVNGKNYRTQSSLATSVEVSCDLRARGMSYSPREAAEIGVTGLEKDSWYLSNLTSWNSNSLNFRVALNDNMTSVPRFCKIRVYFTERATSATRDQSITPRDVNLFLNIDRE